MKPGLRRRLTAVIAVIALLSVAALTLGFNLALRSSLSSDASRLLESRAEAAAESITVRNGRIEVSTAAGEPVPDAQVWVYAGSRVLERPEAASPVDDDVARAAAGKGSGETEDESADLRMRAVPIRDGSGARIGTVVSAVSLEPYERTLRTALIASVAFGAAVILLISLTAWILVGRALRPVAEMTRDAADWSEHDLERRFSVGEPADELTQLAATFDSMLDRMAAQLRHEQRFSAEISHELRTPIAAIRAEAELALRRERDSDAYREALTRITERGAEVTEILETLLLAAREENSTLTGNGDLNRAVEQSVDGLSDLAGACGVRLGLHRAEPTVTVGAEPATVRRILTPLLENACAYGRERVEVTVSRNGGGASVFIEDDGEGFSPDRIEELFAPGSRGATQRNPGAPEGTGLGLSLARRLARAAGGDIDVGAGPGGARVEVRLPLGG